MLSGFMAALAGVIIAARLGSGQADIGANIELDVITVVVVGGTALAGGEGAMWRTAVGVGILAVLGNAFDRLQVDTFWQTSDQGRDHRRSRSPWTLTAGGEARPRAGRARATSRRAPRPDCAVGRIRSAISRPKTETEGKERRETWHIPSISRRVISPSGRYRASTSSPHHVRQLLDQTDGADLVLFPSCSRSSCSRRSADWKETPTSELTRVDEYTQDYRALFESEAKERSQYIVAGSHLMKENGRFVNIGHLFEPDGTVHTHVKTHIFPAEAEWHTEEGDEMESIELPFAKVGFNICYEAEIPECSATLTEQGAEIILCPSFTFTEYGFWRVQALRRRRGHREPGVLRALLHGWPTGRATSQRMGAELDPQPLRPPVEPDGIVAQAS